MKKSILNLGKVLTKEEQQDVNGSITLIISSRYCSDVCPTATSQIPCGPPHCPGRCDGRGGWYNY